MLALRDRHPGGSVGWNLDYDQATEALRGILCHACDVALGNFKHDPDRLRAAIACLDAHREAQV